MSFFANKTPREEHPSDSSADGEMPSTSSDHSDPESDASEESVGADLCNPTVECAQFHQSAVMRI